MCSKMLRLFACREAWLLPVCMRNPLGCMFGFYIFTEQVLDYFFKCFFNEDLDLEMSGSVDLDYLFLQKKSVSTLLKLDVRSCSNSFIKLVVRIVFKTSSYLRTCCHSSHFQLCDQTFAFILAFMFPVCKTSDSFLSCKTRRCLLRAGLTGIQWCVSLCVYQ